MASYPNCEISEPTPEPGTANDSCGAGETRAALVIGHPGHELCVYGWIAQLRPHVFILTDGSGHSNRSRVPHTTAILDRLGAAKGSCYGRFSDAAIYRALLNHDFNIFTELAAEIAETIVKEELTCVVGDASEGFNPTHDACRLIINAAVTMTRERYDRNITNLEFVIDGQPNGGARRAAAQHSSVTLDNQTFEEKLAAARNYPGMHNEVENLVRRYSAQAFRTEYLYRSANDCAPAQKPPYYEEHGEQRVRDGYYQQVIRYHDHLAPLAEKLLGQNGSRDG